MRASEPEPGAPSFAAAAAPELAVILAAGRGARLEPVTRTLPKALLPVLDRPLVAWQLAALHALGIREVVLVVGRERARFEEALGDGDAFGVALAYAVQPEPRGIADALVAAAARLTEPFLCVLGDVFFEPRDLGRLVAGLAGADAALVARAGAEPDELARNFRVSADAAGWVQAVEEKPRAGVAGWMGIGLYAFRPPFLDAARATPPSALRGESELTDAIQRALAAGARVRAVPSAGRAFNLSGPADLLAANLHALDLAGLERWIDARARVAPGAEVERAVVLAGAEVASGARLQRCLVLPGERVPAGGYADVVFAAGARLAAPARA